MDILDIDPSGNREKQVESLLIALKLSTGEQGSQGSGARHRNGERRRAFFLMLFLRHVMP